ncbi:hypothetical protein [Phyllobacterium myrsinacearum]|uniref:Uncharacterized protein n=1 Tax=Phyllobacterium myrsinacearum TaxID=28101 RepID=A0A839EVY4_9HYPH|nr:hypothetical protein [Phyllobacterium myrsinacearum]MBA8881674.1 hypothetical protein [Phyllobacterium myrsinacearum]
MSDICFAKPPTKAERDTLERVYREMREIAKSLNVAIIINGRVYGGLSHDRSPDCHSDRAKEDKTLNG